ncbi:hypothetical protein Btru_058558 [Bulinus truncatus]|nr:hypothetical protein Btru_058558 [Bulinus truncatus]
MGRKGGKGEYPGYRTRLYKQVNGCKSRNYLQVSVIRVTVSESTDQIVSETTHQVELLAIGGGGGGCTTDAECAAKYKGGICVSGTCYRPTGIAEQQDLTTE